MFKITQNTATVLHKGINRFLSKTGSGSPLKLAKCLRTSASAFLQVKTKETSHFLFPLDCSSFSSWFERISKMTHRQASVLFKKKARPKVFRLIKTIRPVREHHFFTPLRLYKTTLTIHRFWTDLQMSVSLRDMEPGRHFARCVSLRWYEPGCTYMIQELTQSLPRVDSSVSS